MSETITDVERVEVDRHRWNATIRIVKRDGSVEEIFTCAEGGHSGLWFGDPDDHGEDCQ